MTPTRSGGTVGYWCYCTVSGGIRAWCELYSKWGHQSVVRAAARPAPRGNTAQHLPDQACVKGLGVGHLTSLVQRPWMA